MGQLLTNLFENEKDVTIELNSVGIFGGNVTISDDGEYAVINFEGKKREYKIDRVKIRNSRDFSDKIRNSKDLSDIVKTLEDLHVFNEKQTLINKDDFIDNAEDKKKYFPDFNKKYVPDFDKSNSDIGISSSKPILDTLYNQVGFQNQPVLQNTNSFCIKDDPNNNLISEIKEENFDDKSLAATKLLYDKLLNEFLRKNGKKSKTNQTKYNKITCNSNTKVLENLNGKISEVLIDNQTSSDNTFFLSETFDLAKSSKKLLEEDIKLKQGDFNFIDKNKEKLCSSSQCFHKKTGSKYQENYRRNLCDKVVKYERDEKEMFIPNDSTTIVDPLDFETKFEQPIAHDLEKEHNLSVENHNGETFIRKQYEMEQENLSPKGSHRFNESIFYQREKLNTVNKSCTMQFKPTFAYNQSDSSFFDINRSASDGLIYFLKASELRKKLNEEKKSIFKKMTKQVKWDKKEKTYKIRNAYLSYSDGNFDLSQNGVQFIHLDNYLQNKKEALHENEFSAKFKSESTERNHSTDFENELTKNNHSTEFVCQEKCFRDKQTASGYFLNVLSLNQNNLNDELKTFNITIHKKEEITENYENSCKRQVLFKSTSNNIFETVIEDNHDEFIAPVFVKTDEVFSNVTAINDSVNNTNSDNVELKSNSSIIADSLETNNSSIIADSIETNNFFMGNIMVEMHNGSIIESKDFKIDDLNKENLCETFQKCGSSLNELVLSPSEISFLKAPIIITELENIKSISDDINQFNNFDMHKLVPIDTGLIDETLSDPLVVLNQSCESEIRFAEIKNNSSDETFESSNDTSHTSKQKDLTIKSNKEVLNPTEETVSSMSFQNELSDLISASVFIQPDFVNPEIILFNDKDFSKKAESLIIDELPLLPVLDTKNEKTNKSTEKKKINVDLKQEKSKTILKDSSNKTIEVLKDSSNKTIEKAKQVISKRSESFKFKADYNLTRNSMNIIESIEKEIEQEKYQDPSRPNSVVKRNTVNLFANENSIAANNIVPRSINVYKKCFSTEQINESHKGMNKILVEARKNLLPIAKSTSCTKSESNFHSIKSHQQYQMNIKESQSHFLVPISNKIHDLETDIDEIDDEELLIALHSFRSAKSTSITVTDIDTIIEAVSDRVMDNDTVFEAVSNTINDTNTVIETNEKDIISNTVVEISDNDTVIKKANDAVSDIDNVSEINVFYTFRDTDHVIETNVDIKSVENINISNKKHNEALENISSVNRKKFVIVSKSPRRNSLRRSVSSLEKKPEQNADKKKSRMSYSHSFKISENFSVNVSVPCRAGKIVGALNKASVNNLSSFESNITSSETADKLLLTKHNISKASLMENKNYLNVKCSKNTENAMSWLKKLEDIPCIPVIENKISDKNNKVSSKIASSKKNCIDSCEQGSINSLNKVNDEISKRYSSDILDQKLQTDSKGKSIRNYKRDSFDIQRLFEIYQKEREALMKESDSISDFSEISSISDNSFVSLNSLEDTILDGYFRSPKQLGKIQPIKSTEESQTTFGDLTAQLQTHNSGLKFTPKTENICNSNLSSFLQKQAALAVQSRRKNKTKSIPLDKILDSSYTFENINKSEPNINLQQYREGFPLTSLTVSETKVHEIKDPMNSATLSTKVTSENDINLKQCNTSNLLNKKRFLSVSEKRHHSQQEANKDQLKQSNLNRLSFHTSLDDVNFEIKNPYAKLDKKKFSKQIKNNLEKIFTDDPDSSGAESFTTDDVILKNFVDSERTVICGNPPCSKFQVLRGQQKSKFKTCQSCFTCYCSNRCKKAHWEDHKRMCLYGRICKYIKSFLKQCENGKKINRYFSKLSAENYKINGKGCLSIKFLSLNEVKFTCKKNVLPTQYCYVQIKEVESDKQNRQNCLLLQTLRDYNPEEEFIVKISVQNQIKKNQSKCNPPSVFRCGRIPFLLTNKLSTLSAYRTFSIPFINLVHINTMETRRYFCREISMSLKRYGFILKDNRVVYEGLCQYVESNIPFQPFLISKFINGKKIEFCITISPFSWQLNI
ncbi:serine-rich adhesin for platelets isoform X1 [Hydra vulgaris]|uniref:Serine-rich adhesin for platelets isoform X1 n=1 Tax=Hydra vulgaris TaxID=6087 RepID=A0ABM4BCQ7_HYDVU